MRQIKNKKGFTLAEVMIVLLVLTILFAAFAPFITKRQRSNLSNQDLWQWATRNYLSGPMDAHYKPIQANNLGGIYIGTSPDSENEIKSSYTPLSKLIIRSGYIGGNSIQKQLQLRYGRNNFGDPGQLAATFLADGNNLLFGGNYPKLTLKYSDLSYPTKNIVFGFNSMYGTEDRNIETQRLENNTAFGYNSLANIAYGKDNTSIGSGSGYQNLLGSENTFIGYSAGSNTISSDNTIIGYQAQAYNGSYNTFIGANSGCNGENCAYNSSYRYNVAAGYKALGNITSGEYNIALGAGALKSLTTGSYNVAIGYNACAGISKQSYKTCIGANSGPAVDTPVYTELGIKEDDITPRTYIGVNPNMDPDSNRLSASGKYGGDAVLEIHNSIGSANKSLINNPSIKSNATTIINGNLIVKGKTFLTMGDSLYPFSYSNNIFGGSINASCAQNQLSYAFPRSGYCDGIYQISSLNTSDRRLKNITSANNNGLNKINELQVYSYIFKNDEQKKKHVGVIAQELQNVFPNSVFKGKDGFLKISTDEIFYAAINAIKELNNKIKYISKKCSVFENKIEKLEKENKKLKEQADAISLRIEKLKNKH